MSDLLELPEWFEGGYTDIEEAVIAYFRWLLGDSVFVCSWLPPGHYTPGSNAGTQPTLRVWRQPGRTDPSLRRDESLVQIASITSTREESWKLTQFVRRLMDDDVISGFPILMSDGEKISFACCEEWIGPQMVPERVVDEKFVPVTFKLAIREPIDLPNYRKILKTLPI